jgi:dipeptidyl aminopeptidase/acylaminoacyl peptidase
MISTSQTAPYGSWKSPITADLIVGGDVSLSQLLLAGEAVYWLEGRPAENGRNVLVKWTAETGAVDVTPPGFSVRSRVHEYGGGAYTVVNDEVYFTHFDDQRLYRQAAGGEPQPVTADGLMRHADMVSDGRGRLICVREDHRKPGEPANSLVSLDIAGGDEGRTLVAGNDFYSSPALAPDGRRLAWLTWNHPDMPWTGAELWLGDLDKNGALSGARRVAGGTGESIFQPQWSADGLLYFVSDRTGWWNLYREGDGGVEALQPTGASMEAEFGRPQWLLGASTYGFSAGGAVICAFTRQGIWSLARLEADDGRLNPIDTPYTAISMVRARRDCAVMLAGSATEPESVVLLDLKSGAVQVVRRSSQVAVDDGYLSQPEAVEFATENGLTAHAFYYPPRNREFRAPAGERPPLLVLSHGGPTSATTTTLNLQKQYWTSRGFAVLDVNYGGSTGYGRDYRRRLDGQWGIVDVNDCANGARYLVNQDLVDGRRLIIRGGSAGGYTTLCALTFGDLFQAGASYYGISDLEAMARETHKFESRYLDQLIGPYPEQRQRYLERSPIHFVDQLNCALVLFQGLEDEVVPPNQAEMMYAAVKAKGLPVAYVPFAGEQHGFRRAENIQRALEGELYFYSRVFGFELPVPVEPIPIENLSQP